MVHRDTQVVEQGHLGAGLIVERYHLVEYREVTRLLDIGHRAENKPAWVVIEATSNIVVATLRQRLILMVTASIGKLGGRNVNDSLAGTLRNLMHKAHEVLITIAESHATTYATLEETGRTAHAEGYHALVLIPYIDHPIELFEIGRASCRERV